MPRIHINSIEREDILFLFLTAEKSCRSSCSKQKYQETLSKGRRLSTVDLLVLTSLDQLLYSIENIIYLLYKTSCLN